MVLLLRKSSQRSQQQVALSSTSYRRLFPFFNFPNRSFSLCRNVVGPLSPPCPIIITRLPPSLLRSLRTAANQKLLPPTSPSSLDLKRDLLRQEGFSPSQVTMLLDNPHFRTVSFEKVACVICFLRAKGVIGVLAGKTLTRTPCILKYSVENLERNCKFFEDLGTGELGLQRLLVNMRSRCVLSQSIDNLQKHIDFLQRIGLDKGDILKIIIACPTVLLLSIERKMEPIVAFFERQGMTKVHFCRLVRMRPTVFGFSLDGSVLADKLEFVRRLGLSIDSNYGAKAVRSWITVKPELLHSKWEYLKLQGFADPEVLKMVKRQPDILVKSKDSLKRKIDYLKDVLNRDIHELATFPAYLALSLENRIAPRFTFLNELKEKGESTKTLSLNTLLTVPDRGFEKQYATGYQKWKAGYRNLLAADV